MKKAEDMVELLRIIKEKNASDLHLVAGAKPKMRINGELIDMPYERLAQKDTQNLCYSIMTEMQKKKLEENFDVDFSFGISGLARFRANVHIQRETLAGAFRLIPHEIPPFDELGIPQSVQELTNEPNGLILVTGPTGSGKSTTLAAMINKINHFRRSHIITIEDPIEFMYRHDNCLIVQREIGSDTPSFASALKHILRQDPDIILIGEMRDLETIEAAITVSETGHLVFATLHTNSAAETINRIIDVFPSYQQPQIRTQLSIILKGIISQHLIKKKDDTGRVLALELLIPNNAIRNLIREDKIPQIYSSMQIGQSQTGMITINQSILNLYKRNIISYEDALTASPEKKSLVRELEKLRRV